MAAPGFGRAAGMKVPWQIQASPRSDASGLQNSGFSEANATYWATLLTRPIGSTLEVCGQFPMARYMVLYRIYYSNNPDDLTTGATNPFCPMCRRRNVVDVPT
jgi:hypothetical protein